jgi:VIT1/CCC1 family predicted Fe2+/Mn2+ transporter
MSFDPENDPELEELLDLENRPFLMLVSVFIASLVGLTVYYFVEDWELAALVAVLLVLLDYIGLCLIEEKFGGGKKH